MNTELSILLSLAQEHPGASYLWSFEDEEPCVLYLKEDLSEVAGGGSAVGYAVIAEIWEHEESYYQVVIAIGDIAEVDPWLGLMNSEENSVTEKEFMRLSDFIATINNQNALS